MEEFSRHTRKLFKRSLVCYLFHPLVICECFMCNGLRLLYLFSCGNIFVIILCINVCKVIKVALIYYSVTLLPVQKTLFRCTNVLNVSCCVCKILDFFKILNELIMLMYGLNTFITETISRLVCVLLCNLIFCY